MNSIRLPDQNVVPTKEQNILPEAPTWEKMMRTCSDHESILLWQHAVRSIDQDVMWGLLVGISERVMTERGIRFHPDPD